MIVTCTGCQARFRVADEKVGPRGARVRCSRCQTVFVVKRDAEPAPPPAPKIELDLTPGLRGISPAGSRPAPPPAGAAVVPFPASAPQAHPAAPDPFTAAGLDAFGEPEPAADDPFARVAGPRGGLAPAVPGPARAEAPPAAGDPFSQPAPAPSFGKLSTGATGAQSLAVTDLSQILGSAAAVAAPPAPPPAAPAPDPFAQTQQLPRLADEPQQSQEPQLGEEPRLGAPPPSGQDPEPAAGPFPADLALEEKSGSHLAPFADPADVVGSNEAGAASFDGAAFEAVPLGAFSGPEEPLALATEPTPGGAEALAPPPVPGPPEPAPRHAGPAVAVATPDAEEEDRRQAGLARPGETAGNRIRSAAVSALALVALLAIALGFRVVLRGEASLGPSALRPSTLLRALRSGARETGPFEVAEVRTGVYPRSSGGTVLFVRGEVTSRAPGPVGAVRIEAELVRDGQVLARGESRAGAVPTPEEVDRAGTEPALQDLAAALRKRAPRSVRPGDRLAFLVMLGDAPADVSGTSVRVHAEPDDAMP